MGLALLAALALAAAAWWWSHRVPMGPVILISIDTLRADHLPVYGYEGVETPAIDAFAKDAVVFDHAYTHAPQTLPAHTAILTGQLPVEHGVRDNVGFFVPKKAKTLAHAFHDRGFATGAFVSSIVLRAQTGLARGFDTYDSHIAPRPNIVDGKRIPMTMGMVQRPGSETVAAAQTWIRSHLDTPFFAFVHLFEPHTPYNPPKRFLRNVKLPYDGEIAHVDEILERFFRFLREKGLYDKATIILLSDHGEGLGDHGEREHGMFLYQATTHVALMVKLPGQRLAGQRVPTPVQHIDIVPTLGALYDLPAWTTSGRGANLLDFVGVPTQPRKIYAEAMYPRLHYGWRDLYSMTTDRYRYILANKEELYDLNSDPDEKTNLAGDHQREAEELRWAIEDLIENQVITQPADMDATVARQLESLGYVGTVKLDDDIDPSTLPDPKEKIHLLDKINEARQILAEGQIAQAQAMLEGIVRDNPLMIDAWRLLANVFRKQGHPEREAEVLQKVVELNPSDVYVIRSLTEVLSRLGRVDEAIEHAQLAVHYDAALGYQMLSQIYLGQGDEDQALAFAEKARQENPESVMADYVRARVLHRQRRYEEAAKLLREIAEGIEERPTASIKGLYFFLADSLGRLGDAAGAETYFHKELEWFPEDLETTLRLAALYKAEGKETEMVELLEKALEVDPSPDKYLRIIHAFRIFGNTWRARLWAARAMDLYGDDPRVRDALEGMR